jgi:hypothetical protein
MRIPREGRLHLRHAGIDTWTDLSVGTDPRIGAKGRRLEVQDALVMGVKHYHGRVMRLGKDALQQGNPQLSPKAVRNLVGRVWTQVQIDAIGLQENIECKSGQKG